MKKLLLSLACLAVMAGSAFSQSASFTLTDNGLYGGTTASGTFSSTDTFTLSLFGDINGFTARGFSLFLQAPTANGFNTTIQITSATYFQFTDTTSAYPQTFTMSLGSPSAGNLTTEDIGATGPTNGSQDTTGNNVHLADYTFSLTGVPAGTYTISSTTNSGFNDNNSINPAFIDATPTSYSITVVPEPSTWSFLALGGLGSVGLMLLRRRRAA